MNVYKQMWAAMVQAASIPDPELPVLAKFASGEALRKLRYSLVVDLQYGFVTRGPLRIAPQSTAVSPGEVQVTDCLDDSQALKYKSDGSLKDDIPGGRHQVEATVTRAGADWKVSDLHVKETGTC
ncbi:hypothetical protein [Yinghuangia seranimata]|uniref:hypothetical protein n=1 Tax=Yinghuangia seranimata TaxID=408067 RepID=UPI00248C1A19|nr:hypothetical protein [Yinghuangia seranimata]MDI2127151.1 hypothetical protein [Yinghuangia seranimata]